MTFKKIIGVSALFMCLCACVDQQALSDKQLLAFDRANAKAYQFKQNGTFSYAICGDAKFPCSFQPNDLSNYNCRITKNQHFYKTIGDMRLQTTSVQYLTCTRK